MILKATPRTHGTGLFHAGGHEVERVLMSLTIGLCVYLLLAL